MLRHLRTLSLILGLVGIGAAAADDPPSPRLGLTAAQTRQAVRIAADSMTEARQKSPAPRPPDADPREYVVSVVRLDEKTKAPKPAAAEDAPTKAVVTTYRYADDTTVYSTVDLATSKTIEVSTSQHMQTPLSDGEYEAAKALAREQSEDVKALYEKFGKRIDVYAQFSQATPKGEDRVHRIVLILYRVDKRDLSSPRPMVDLTTRKVTIAKPEDEDDAPDRTRKAQPPR